MRALVGAFGTRGDVQPAVALVQALVARGHSVSLAASPSSLDLALAQGLQASPVGLDYESVSARAGRGSLIEMAGMLPLLRREVSVQLTALEERARGTDIVIGASAFVAGSLLAEAAGTPFVCLALGPQMFESAEYPSFAVPFQRMPRAFNRLSWVFHRFLFDRLLKGTLNHQRAVRGLPRVRSVWPSVLGCHLVAAVDPALAPAPSDHPVPITQVGALWLEDARELSEPVRAFLAAGPAPMYIGFGSMPDPDPVRTTRRLLEAVGRAGVRAIISRGWARLGVEATPDGVIFVESEPHALLFPRCAGIVHHGGAGTTHAAARAGVPQVVMPYLLDQHFWSHRTRVTGISATSVPRHGSDPEPLARAMRLCIEDEALRARARELSFRIGTDGVRRAADLVERIAG